MSFAQGRTLDTSAEREARRTFAAVLKALGSRSRVAVALRRFGGSHEPRHDEDRLLDLWIAMEALFSPDDTTEVSFRLSLNAANYVEVEGLTRRALFEWLRKGYALRSSIAHGRDPELKKHVRLHGGQIKSLAEAAEELGEVVRIALLRYLFEPGPPDFTALALGTG